MRPILGSKPFQFLATVKRIAIWLSALCLFLTVASCVHPYATTNYTPETIDHQPSPHSGSSVDLSTKLAATHPWKIVFVSQDGPKGHENIPAERCSEVVWCHMWEAARQTGRELGVEPELAYVDRSCTDDNHCIRQQIELVNTLIERGGIDGIVIGPRDSNKLVPVIEKAIAANISVITVGTPINSPRVLTLVTYDDFSGGRSIGNWVAERLNGEGNIVIIEGPKYQNNALERRLGYIAGLRDTNIKILDTETVLWDCSIAQEVTEQWLDRYPNIDAIIAASDHMALGARIAIGHANRQDILITGYDAIPVAKAAIANGLLGASIEQFPNTTTPTAMQLLIRHLETGETFPPIVYLNNSRLIQRSNNLNAENALPNDLDETTLSCNF